MKKTLTLIAAAATFVIANSAVAPVAEAGGGVRLNFGFPLGSFTARPSGRSVGSQSYSHSNSSRYHANKRAAAERRARIQAAKAAAAAERRQRAHAAAAAERRERLAAAAAAERRERIAAQKAAARRLARDRRDSKEEVARVEPQAIAPNAVPLPQRVEVEREADVAVGKPQVIVTPAKTENVAKETEKVAAAAPAPAPVATRVDSKLDCKKFVPSAGLTITVPCVQ
ncbi:MAG: hypothetical protein KDJ37_13145 [Hyphomicrobiaceae bacterium]|nr:hypothetical protein [Hyphomicrobiaceae bacterium]